MGIVIRDAAARQQSGAGAAGRPGRCRATAVTLGNLHVRKHGRAAGAGCCSRAPSAPHPGARRGAGIIMASHNVSRYFSTFTCSEPILIPAGFKPRGTGFVSTHIETCLTLGNGHPG